MKAKGFLLEKENPEKSSDEEKEEERAAQDPEHR